MHLWRGGVHCEEEGCIVGASVKRRGASVEMREGCISEEEGCISGNEGGVHQWR